MDGQFSRGIFLFQGAREIAVYFNRMHMIDGFQKRAGQGAQAWTDFDKSIARLRRNNLNEPPQDALVGQKVLPKAFACTMVSQDECASGKTR